MYKTIILCLLAIAVTAVSVCAYAKAADFTSGRTVGSEITIREEPDGSGSGLPSYTNEDSILIRNAPAFDTAEAASCIDAMPQIRELADTVGDDEQLALFGPAAPSEEALAALQEEIEKLTDEYHKVSLIMADLKTKSGVAYNSSVPMCTQSTIKGVYLGSALEERPELLEENWQAFHDAIVYSDNDAYEGLREACGPEPLLKWCAEAGVDAGFADLPYPRSYTAKDMFKMWTVLYRYLNGGTCSPEFASWFADSLASAARIRFGDRYPVQTKAGWETGYYEPILNPDDIIPDQYVDGDPTNDEIAANDSGVVFTEKGPYLFVIFTDHFFDYFENVVLEHPLCELEEALCNVQLSLQ